MRGTQSPALTPHCRTVALSANKLPIPPCLIIQGKARQLCWGTGK